MIHVRPFTRRDAARASRLAAAGGLRVARAGAGDKTVRFILPNATGSGVDAITRAAQPALAKALGHAGRRRQPAGRRRHRRAAGAGALGARRHHAQRGVEQRRDLSQRATSRCRSTCRATSRRSPIVGATPIVLVVNPTRCRPRTRKEFDRAAEGQARRAQLRLGRQRHHPAPGRRACSSTRPASRRRHIPYKGVGPMVTDLIGGQVDFAHAGAAERAGSTSRAARCAPSAWRTAQRVAGRAGDPDLRRAGPAELRGRSLVRGDRAQGHERRPTSSACTTRWSPPSPTRR